MVEQLGMSEADKDAIQRFEKDIVQPSMEKLVILQFTAGWCGPCKQLSPILDQVAADYADKGVILKRIDVDSEKTIAAAFRIQSVPTVYAFFQGQPLADLTQYRTPGQLGQAIDQILKQMPVQGEAQDREAQIAPLIEQGNQLLDANDHEQALALFSQLQSLDPENPKIIGGLARAMILAGHKDEARQMLDGVDEKIASDSAVAQARAMLEVTAEGEEAVDTSAYVARIEAEPDDHEARFELAKALMAKGERDGAADHLLEIVRRDPEWQDGAAKAKFLALLEAAGLEDSWSSAQRRRLSAVLFT
ncbi:tetratricopeptide repeat protein [Sphingomicrobium lutaoense]|uniref:Putative thioredoxin n=1 Tax=Sphingomicrobium lutaoense TaxID=515949 RepID=A0A839Z7G1_9SPHN|nr:tetratricopeptide repeat protein [Sphingomicrobium lutaoense]MBB3764774.1 putative thioredoxin [Sphingomicrobium lutaoense]